MTTTAPPGVVAMVTGEALLQRLDQLSTRLGQVESNTSQVPNTLLQFQQEQAKQGERISALERWRSFWTGAATLATLLLTGGVVVAIVTAVHK